MTNISDLIRQSFLLGIGAISLTADKLQEWTNELVERGEMTRDQAASMISELTKRGQETREELRDMVKDEVKKAMDGLNVPTKADIRRIEDKLDRLILMEQAPQAEMTETIIETGEASP